jgi:GNAT superfamily N-acetyltransferase
MSNKQKFTIRRAEKRDCPRLLELITELAVYERAPQAVTATLHHLTESGFGSSPVWWGFVACTYDDPAHEGEEFIVGFALYYIRYSTWKGQRLYLEDLIVTDTYRRKGIGKLLFDRLFVETIEKGFSGMAWQVLDWNQPAIDFYKTYGAEFESGWVNCTVSLDSIRKKVSTDSVDSSLFVDLGDKSL